MAFPTITRRSIGAIITLVIVIGAVGIMMFTQKERARELVRWQDKLNLIADARARDVNGWVQTQFRELSAVANNPALQIYFATLQAAPVDADAPRPAQADYLHNLLTLTAQRLAFQSAAPAPEQQIRANAGKLATGGLALLDSNGTLIMATSSMPALNGALAEAIKTAPRGKPSLIDIAQPEGSNPRIGFIVPVFGVQGDRSPAGQKGMLVGVKPVDTQLFPLLNPQTNAQKSLEVALARKEGDSVRYLSPLMDQSLMTQREQDNATTQAAAYAVANPGDFAERIDYRAKDVLVTGRAITDTPWSLIVKIDRAEALADSNAWRRTIAIIFGLVILAMASTLLAVWRHASALRSQELTQVALRISEESQARAALLSLVTSHQPEPLFIVDEKLNLWLANDAAATAMHADAGDMVGKPLANVAGPALAQALQPHCVQALESGVSHMAMLERMDGAAMHTICTRFVPLSNIPVEGLDASMRGVLVTEQDMSEVINEREKRMHTLNQLIAMLVSLVDRRDPHAAQHSSHVAMVATATARGMGLDSETVETTHIAAQLMNLGKIDIPAEMLVRKGALNNAERDAVRHSLSSSAQLLEGIEFNGPVSETLRQTQEHVDGSGPMKRKGDDILISARIIAAANALVGMLSPRAYRPALPMDEAIATLLGQVDAQFDRGVVVAMVNYLDNQQGRSKLLAVLKASA